MDGCAGGMGAEYRWPLLFSVPVVVWVLCWRNPANWCPALNPGDVSSQRVAERDHRGVEWLPGEGDPQFQLVAAAATLVAAVATAGHVHGEVAGPVGVGTM
jgi:hypothetical protein